VNYKQFFVNAGHERPTDMQAVYLQDSQPFSILLSNTGSGKTLAFLVKLISILEKSVENENVLILCPTRELAHQVAKNWSALKTNRKMVLCYGGHSFKNEAQQLAEKPQIIVATPGRILDHFRRETIGLVGFSHLIIDEYDKTLEMGFLREINEIYTYGNSIQSIQLISATQIDELPAIVKDFRFSTHDFLEAEKPQLTYHGIKADGHDKLLALVSFLATLPPGPTLIFCSHREATERISNHLIEYGKSNVLFHGGMDQPERERALIKFKNGTENVLVCTDLAARGLDIPDINYVIHYQFPHTLQDFTHRNGRTARMQKDGKIFLVHSAEEPLPEYTNDLEINPVKVPELIGHFQQTGWSTLFLTIGRKDKIRKMDIAGFFMKDLQCDFSEIGLIDVFDTYSYIAIRTKKLNQIKGLLHKKKIKKVAVRISDCR
jgi:superfamily II DNA/RNA helicase